MKQKRNIKGKFIGSGSKVTVHCANCGNSKILHPCRLIFDNHFCSSKCKAEWQSKNNRGNKNPNWKGGIHYDKNGYKMIYLPKHHRAHTNGYVYEHILVMEEKIGKKVHLKWEVHHLNGIRDDNRPENLALVKPKNHERNTIKAILQARIRELELNNK